MTALFHRGTAQLGATRSGAGLAIGGVALLIVSLSAPALPAFADDSGSGLSVTDLRADDLVDPLGIDNTTPVLSWKVGSADNGAEQTAYQVRAASAADAIESADLWDTGKVASSAVAVDYAGAALESRSRIYWQVRVWDADGSASAWSEVHLAEIGLLEPSEWTGQWIADPTWSLQTQPVTVLLDKPTTARYVTLDVQKLGLALKGENQYYLQLAELELRDGAAGENVARGAAVTAPDVYEGSGWSRANLVDGVTDTQNSSARGFTSSAKPTQSSPMKITLDLGGDKAFDRVVLWPRTDVLSADGHSAAFPSRFTVSARADAAPTQPAQPAATASNLPAPAFDAAGIPLDIPFSTPQTGRYVRVDIPTVTGPVGSGPNKYLAQLAELQVLDADGANLAQGAPLTTSSSLEGYGWGRANLVDGSITTANGAARGWTTDPALPTSTVNARVTVDLGTSTSVSGLRLWGRTDQGATVSFPSGYTVTVADSFDSVNPDGPIVAQYDDPVAPAGAVAPGAGGLPVLATDFQVDPSKTVADARLYVAGLGNVYSSINGEATSDDVLAPGYTDYQDRVEYSTYDVSSLLEPGANAIGIELGTGPAYIPDGPGYEKYTANFSYPKAIAQLEVNYTDGTTHTVATDTSWKSTAGPTTVSNWFSGEEYDARAEVTDWNVAGTDRSGWRTPVVVGGTEPKLTGRYSPPLQVTETLDAAAPVTLSDTSVRYDLPKNIAGWMELTVTAPSGTKLQLWPGERLKADGTVDQSALGTPVYNAVTTDGGTTTWHTRFRYDGYQYIEVRGITPDVTISDVHGLVVRASNEQVGSFSSSDPTIDAVHQMIDRSVQSNMYSVLTDCPHREKLGWLEETHLVFGTIMRNYDVSAYSRSIVQKIAEAQLPNGQVPSIAPEYSVFAGGFRDDPNWGGALILMPWAMYQNYGDVQTLKQYYSAMAKYVTYLDTRRSGTTNTYGDDALGDWAELGVTTDKQLVTTFGYYRAVDAMAGIAAVLGNEQDAAYYSGKRDAIRADTITRWYDPATKVVANGTQAAYAVALDMDAVPADDRDAVAGKLVDAITANGSHLNVGEIALPSVYRVLAKYGHDDLIYTTVTQTSQPSFGAFVEAGLTSLPEYWDMKGSLNHFMLGAVDEWFSTRLAGITQADDSVAFEDLVFKPTVVGGMTHAEAGYRTKYGQVATSWTLTDGAAEMHVTVPVGSRGTVYVPTLGADTGATIPEHQAGAAYSGITTLEDGDYWTFTVGSGDWAFGPERVQPGAISATVSPPTPNGANGWYSSGPVTVSFTSDDAGPVEYRLVTAGDADPAWTAYTQPLVFGDGGIAEGDYSVEYRSVVAGSASDSIPLKFDSTAPIAQAQLDPDARTVTLSADDTNAGLGLDIEYALQKPAGDAVWTSYSGAVAVGDDAVTVLYRATDVAGNVSGEASLDVAAAAAGGPGAAGPGDGTAPAGSDPGQGALGATGATALPLIVLGVLLAAGGALLAFAVRRRRAGADSAE